MLSKDKLNTKRTFIIGDEWLYYKLYCGVRMSDIILIETIKPLTEKLKEEGIIDKWFFIRYNDPESHLRVRFHLSDFTKNGEVILALNNALQYFINENIIYQVQVDTYQREIERYGSGIMIEEAENLFYYDSLMTTEAISIIEDEKLYFLFVIKAIDQLLNSFGYTIHEKLNLTSQNKNGFKKEFNSDKRLSKQLDQKYRELKNSIITFLNSSYTNEEFKALDQIINHKTNKTVGIISQILEYSKENSDEVQLNNLVSSYIHMLVNRSFRSKQRFYELIIYDFLHKNYKSQFVKNSFSNSN